MYLIITLVSITVILFIVGFLKDVYGEWFNNGDVFHFLGYICLFLTIVSILLIPVCRYYSNGRIAEYETRKATIERSRKNDISEMERVMLTKEIIDDNTWLSDCKYHLNNKWFNLYYDKKILELKPIE